MIIPEFPETRKTKSNRNILYKGKSIPILSLARKYKGRYVISFQSKVKKKFTVKVSCVPVALPSLPDVPLYLILCFV